MNSVLFGLQGRKFFIYLDNIAIYSNTLEKHFKRLSGIKPDNSNIDAVINFPVPKLPKNIKSFLRLAGYYRKYIENFSKISRPLSELLKN